MTFDELPPEPSPLGDLERLAVVALRDVFPAWSIDELAEWLRSFLRREIARRLRDETSVIESAPPARVLVSGSVLVPNARALRWVERIPGERLDELLVAIAAVRRDLGRDQVGPQSGGY